MGCSVCVFAYEIQVYILMLIKVILEALTKQVKLATLTSLLKGLFIVVCALLSNMYLQDQAL